MSDRPRAGPDRQRAMPLRGWPQRLLHLVAVLAGWAIFILGWYKVLGRPWETRSLWLLIIGSLLVLPTLTFVWILHNRSIYRRKGPRTGVAVADTAYTHDWNGREIEADWSGLAGAPLVVIDREGERKVFRAAPASGWPAPTVHGAGPATDIARESAA